ncbi:MAG: hypothetical protein MJE68_24615 [Proteobacteria bacterium]|nr:hypothetical protein [Pseudomonadota bacterium]
MNPKKSTRKQPTKKQASQKQTPCEDSPREVYLRGVFGDAIDDLNNKKDDCKRKQMEKKIATALKEAHEIRRFEVGLYWQRSLYFWGFIVAFLVGFTSLLTADNISSWVVEMGLLFLALLGFFTSFALLFVHKGSRFWQRNWELHIDFLEEEVTGNLHKCIIEESKHGEWDSHYSLNKINRNFIVIIIIMWALLFAGAWMNFFFQCHAICLLMFKKEIVFAILIFLSSLALTYLLTGYWRRHDDYKYEKPPLHISGEDKNGKKIVLHKRKLPPYD